MVVTVLTLVSAKADHEDVAKNHTDVVKDVTALTVTMGRQDERLKRIEDDVKWIRTRLEARP